MESSSIELLADVLDRAAGWGLARRGAHRWLSTQPVLRQLARIDPSLGPDSAGCAIYNFIQESVEQFDGSRKFLGRTYEASTLKKAWAQSLELVDVPRIDIISGPAPVRCYWVMVELEIPETYDNWR